MRTLAATMLANFRKVDKLVMHMITIPAVIVVTVLFLAMGPATTAIQVVGPSQETVNALSNEHIDQLNRRMDEMSRVNDERFNRTDRFIEVILGVMLTILATLMVNTIQNKNRRRN